MTTVVVCVDSDRGKISRELIKLIKNDDVGIVKGDGNSIRLPNYLDSSSHISYLHLYQTK